MKVMRRSLAASALLLAWLCAQGFLLDSVQVFAWAKMYAGYARTLSWSAAVAETFDPGKPCAICCAVRKAREHRSESSGLPAREDGPSLVFALVTTEVWVERADLGGRHVQVPPMIEEWLAPVPKPPPRAALA